MQRPLWLEILGGAISLLLAESHKDVWDLTNCCHFNTQDGGKKKGQDDNFGSIRARCTSLPRANRAVTEEWSYTISSPPKTYAWTVLVPFYKNKKVKKKKKLRLSTMSQIVNIASSNDSRSRSHIFSFQKQSCNSLASKTMSSCKDCSETRSRWLKKETQSLLFRPSSSVRTEVSWSKRPVRANGKSLFHHSSTIIDEPQAPFYNCTVPSRWNKTKHVFSHIFSTSTKR